MNDSSRFKLKLVLLLSALLGGAMLASCATSSSPSSMAESQLSNSDAAAVMNQSIPASAPNALTDGATAQAIPKSPAVLGVPRSLPQLIKTAELAVTVESIKKSIDAATAIARQQQGDLLGLQDQTLPDNSRQTASLQIRVPQTKLEATLKALSELGTVQRQSITAEDVSNQLVDYQARLRNLKNTEEMLLKIMQRSGSVGDVLKVAQELSNVRNSIEQIDAQLSDLQNQVAYSSISLSLEGAIATTPPQRATETQLQETWDGATRSLSQFTVDLLQLGIWLMVYSPYLLLIGGGGAIAYLRLRRPTLTTPQAPPRSNE